MLVASQRYENLFYDYFHAKTHAVNLAIFRIAFFTTLYARPSLRTILGLLDLPDSARVSPPGLDWWVANLPESPELNTWLYRLFLVACVCGAVGFCTRYACAIAAVLTLYLMGIPQFFGKIDHHHHLVWMSTLLAVSRCGDAFSIDAWLKSRKGIELQSPVSRAYALPLRFVWLFLGVMYFFPGLWKYVVSGPDWFLSQNFEARVMLRQFVGEGWEPPIPIYDYSTLCTIGSLVTIVMEVGFILMMFLPFWRYVAAVTLFCFHWAVKLFLNISFWPVQIYYISFVDWHSLFQRLRGKLFEVAQPISHIDELGKRVRAVFAVGLIFVCGNIATGFTMIDSWPFGVYPTFARIIGPTFDSISFRPIAADGTELDEVETLFDPQIREAYGVSIGRLSEIMATASRPHSQREQRMANIWKEWFSRQTRYAESELSGVNFYLVTYSTKPDASKEPVKYQLLESIRFAGTTNSESADVH